MAAPDARPDLTDVVIRMAGVAVRRGKVDPARRRRVHRGREAVEVAHHAHAAPAPTGAGLRPAPGGRSVTSAGRGSASTGTPAVSIGFLASTLLAICSMDSGVGPTQVSPASMTARAKSALSERNP